MGHSCPSNHSPNIDCSEIALNTGRIARYFMDQNERRVSRSLRLDFTQMGCQKWLGFRLKALGSIVSMLVALLVVLHRSLGPLGRAISGPAAGLALRYAQQLSNAMEGS